MQALLRHLAPILFVLVLAGPLWAVPSTPEYLGWLEQRSQLWVQEMKRMESHEHGQYKMQYRQLSELMVRVREQATELKAASEGQADALRQQLMKDVSKVEHELEFLLSETPELADRP
jgi:hypothetical protein